MEKEENQKSGSIDKSQKEEIPENNISENENKIEPQSEEFSPDEKE